MTLLILFTSAWVAGILVARAFGFPCVWFLLALPPALVLLLGWGDRRWARRGFAVLLGVLLGGGRMALSEPQITPEHVAFYRGAGTVEVVGVVVAEPDRRSTDIRLRLRVEQLKDPDGETSDVGGRLLVYGPAHASVHYGDRIRVSGELRTPPVFPEFSYRDYLARQGIHALLRVDDISTIASHQANPLLDALFRFKVRAHEVLVSLLPEPQASLLAGILLGIEQGIPEHLDEAFVATGTSHVVAVSGFNLTLAAALVTRFGRRWFRGWTQLIASWLIIWVYVLLVGASAAVMRAGVMSSVLVLGQCADRKVHGPTSVAAAVLFLTLGNPYALWDTGFQLSVAAMLALMLYVPPITEWAVGALERFVDPDRARRWVSGPGQILIVTLAVQIATLGITVGTFRRISLIAPLTNQLILPIQPFVMTSGALTLAVGLLARPLGSLLGWITWVFLAYTTTVVEWTATFPLAEIKLGSMAASVGWAYYLVLILLSGWLMLSDETRVRVRAAAQSASPAFLAGGAVLVLLVAYQMTHPDGRLHVAFLATEGGDAVFMQTPTGRQVLIDGGRDPRQTLSAISKEMPFWDRSLDLVILTSPDPSRLDGLVPVLERYDVGFVGFSPEVGFGSTFERWRELLAERPRGASGILWRDDCWELDEAVHLEVLWPARGEEGPLILQIVHGEVRFLLMGDATAVVEGRLLSLDGVKLRSHVLQLARHGDKTCCSAPFVQAVAPEVGVVSPTSAGIPPVVSARMMDTPLYRTDKLGTIRVVSDGDRIQITPRLEQGNGSQ
ncbi:MAG: ComEC/Rec2 family competence protein [Anaerolineae bacterium]